MSFDLQLVSRKQPQALQYTANTQLYHLDGGNEKTMLSVTGILKTFQPLPPLYGLVYIHQKGGVTRWNIVNIIQVLEAKKPNYLNLWDFSKRGKK